MTKTDKKEYRTRQIPVTGSIEEYLRLIEFLRKKDYDIIYYLENIDYKYPALIVDICHKEVYGSNVTCMAAWCNNGTQYPLNVEEFIDNYDEFVVKNNMDKYFATIHEKGSKKKEGLIL